MTRQIVHIETDKNTSIPWNMLNPHYSDNRFHNNDQTVFLAPGYELVSSFRRDVVDGAGYYYSDRLVQWDREKAEKSLQEASEKFPDGSPALYEDYLRRYYENPALELVHIIAGVNLGSGYPYRVYGYITHKEE